MRVTYTLRHITSSEYEGKKECTMVTCNKKNYRFILIFQQKSVFLQTDNKTII